MQRKVCVLHTEERVKECAATLIDKSEQFTPGMMRPQNLHILDVLEDYNQHPINYEDIQISSGKSVYCISSNNTSPSPPNYNVSLSENINTLRLKNAYTPASTPTNNEFVTMPTSLQRLLPSSPSTLFHTPNIMPNSPSYTTIGSSDSIFDRIQSSPNTDSPSYSPVSLPGLWNDDDLYEQYVSPTSSLRKLGSSSPPLSLVRPGQYLYPPKTIFSPSSKKEGILNVYVPQSSNVKFNKVVLGERVQQTASPSVVAKRKRKIMVSAPDFAFVHSSDSETTGSSFDENTSPIKFLRGKRVIQNRGCGGKIQKRSRIKYTQRHKRRLSLESENPHTSKKSKFSDNQANESLLHLDSTTYLEQVAQDLSGLTVENSNLSGEDSIDIGFFG